MISFFELVIIKFIQGDDNMNYDSVGYLQINAYSAAGAVPIEKINIRIFGNNEMNGNVNYSLLTDRNGQSKIVSLPAPQKEYSETPAPSEVGFATYNVEVFGNGFYPKILYDVSIFPGIKSVLNLEMIPNGGMTQNVSPPLGDNISIIEENEDLS